MKNNRVTNSKAISRQVGSVKLAMLFIVTSISSVGLASDLGVNSDLSEGTPVEIRAAVKQCGTVSYDPLGGSLVINHYVLQVANTSLEANLIREAQKSPFSACLIGTWLNLPSGKVFQADSMDE